MRKSVPYPFPFVANCKSVDQLLWAYLDGEHGITADLEHEKEKPKEYVEAVHRWVKRPKLDPVKIKMDWTAYEKAFAKIPDSQAFGDDLTDAVRQVFVLFGTGRSGKTVSARWLSDCFLFRAEHASIPAFVTAAKFYEYGRYPSKAAGLVQELQGVGQERCVSSNELAFSVIDGIGDKRLSVTEVFALMSAIEGCTDQLEYGLIVTTRAPTSAAFLANVQTCPDGDRVAEILADRGIFVQFKTDRIAACPFMDAKHNLLEPYEVELEGVKTFEPIEPMSLDAIKNIVNPDLAKG